MSLVRCKRLLLLTLLVAGPLSAQSPPSIERVRLGLPTGRGGGENGCSRNLTWTPVAVDLRAGDEAIPGSVYRLRLQSTDRDELAYQTTAEVPAIAARSQRTVMGYFVPATDTATVTVSLLSTEGKVVVSKPVPARDPAQDLVLSGADVMFFGVGTGLSPLRRAGAKADGSRDPNIADLGEGRAHFAATEDVSQLPDRWIGYDGVDVVILGLGKRELVLQLAEESQSARRNALLEWVRRGGTLVVSLGRNRQEAEQLLTRMPLINVKITGGETVAGLPTLSNQWCERINLNPLQRVELATVVPGPGVDVLVRDGKQPVLLQSACGLGRVILATFDLDAPPFSTWDGAEAFWSRLIREVVPYLVQRVPGKAEPAQKKPQPGAGAQAIGMNEAQKYDLRAELKRGLETFEEVPTISFAWVALFLLLYILLIGPVDYFLLKKVFKRMEWTWVTFPALVLLSSIAAYATAYSLKGEDLRINKIDLVEVDLEGPGGGQIYGHTWATLFSPRTANYTLATTPVGQAWTGKPATGNAGTVVTLLEGGESTFRAGVQIPFRQPYDYAPEEIGVSGLPTPVWSTRSIVAEWRTGMPASGPPLDARDEGGPLRVSRDGKGLVGRLTNNLGVTLQDVTLIYRERCYLMDRLEPGESRRLEQFFGEGAQGQGREVTRWQQDNSLASGLPQAPSGRPITSAFLNGRSSHLLMKTGLFFHSAQGTNASNMGLRRLDQSWRLASLSQYPIPDRPRFRSEAMLVARTPMLSDRSDQVLQHPASPTKLWFGKLPQEGAEPPSLPGIVTQETYLRVFLPVLER